ncbi:MAG: hypothetical protein M1835_000179 [Candelina submexicana]|nr:MAG: hypothetical protein M1835_000179 [Candelina submexicana]
MLEEREQAKQQRERREGRIAESTPRPITVPKKSQPSADPVNTNEPACVVKEASPTQEQSGRAQAAQPLCNSTKPSSPPRARVPNHVVKGAPSSSEKETTSPRTQRRMSTSKSAPAPASTLEATPPPKASDAPGIEGPPSAMPPPNPNLSLKAGADPQLHAANRELSADIMRDEGSGIDDASSLLRRAPPPHRGTMKTLAPLLPAEVATISKPLSPPLAAVSSYKPPSVVDVPEPPLITEQPSQLVTQHQRPASSATRHIHWPRSIISRSPTSPDTGLRTPFPPAPPAQRSSPPRHLPPTQPTKTPRRVRWEVESQSDVGMDDGLLAADNFPRDTAHGKLEVVVELDSSLDGSAVDDCVDLERRMPVLDKGVEDLIGGERRVGSNERR